MKTDWENYRLLKEGEIIRRGDQQLSPNADEDGWDEIDCDRIGTPASDPLPMGHMNYRRPISLENTKHINPEPTPKEQS